jgi:radical SAM superfamily enzyme YgiQ (UPF0313 family)
VGIISVFTDYHRRGRHHRGVLQPQIGPLVAALLPPGVEIDVVNDTWDDPDWSRGYDLLLLSALHSDFDRARQISHYWRRRGAKTVLGGPLASTYPRLCAPYFDAVAVGDPESTVPEIYRDFAAGELQPIYRAERYQAQAVPVPRLDLVARKQIVPLALEATRGCPFTCDFCTLTGLGTRYHTRAAETIVAQLREAQRLLEGRVPRFKQRLAAFYDNNLGGSAAFLRALCDALAPTGLLWAGCVTFNLLRDAAMLDRLAASGCRLVYFGLETFNPAALADMGKHQNVLAETRDVIDACRSRGILATAGLMLSPTMDTVEDIDRIPAQLEACGLHVPTYICFETPFPGTPYFKRLAAAPEAQLLPNVLLRDLNGYTLAVRPRHATPEEFVAAYLRTHRSVYSLATRLRKLADDLGRFPRGRFLMPAVVDLFEMLVVERPRPPGRSYIAGAEKAPPESTAVPFADDDFASERERATILEPWPVTDARGRVLPRWLGAQPLYLPKGRIAPRPAAVAVDFGRLAPSAAVLQPS